MTAHPLRSRNWFGRNDLDGFVHRSWLKTEGFSDVVFDGRPVVGIANSWSELTNCNAHLRQVAEAVKRGVWSSGGFPLEFPTISLGEVLMKPTAMMFRNLMAMDVEECIRAYPLDAVVLLSGCDKTTPAMLMGAASADVPAIMVTGGPMLRGKWRTEELGSGTDVWRLWAERRAGRMTDEELCEGESCMSRSSGHCMVMGTASTMASMAEALGMTLPGNAAIPAPDSRRLALAEASGRRAVELARAGGPRPSDLLTAQAFDNAIRSDMAIGGSTNAIIHLVALAGRAQVPLPLARFDALSRSTPLLVNLKPSGKYLMEDFFYAGGLPAVLRELLPLLHGDALTVNGRTLADTVRHARCWNEDVIRSLQMPLAPEGGTVILSGNLCPDGAVLKQSAASPHLLTHRGRAVVFRDHDDLHHRIDDPALPIDDTSVLVLQHAGPRGAPGMPECGTSPPNPPSAGRWRSSATATRSSSTCRRAGSRSGSRTRSLHAAARPGRRDRLGSRAVTAASSSTTCCRRTRGATSISWAAGPRCARRTRRDHRTASFPTSVGLSHQRSQHSQWSCGHRSGILLLDIQVFTQLIRSRKTPRKSHPDSGNPPVRRGPRRVCDLENA